MDIIRAWDQINLLTVTDKKYSKAFEKLRKILIKLVDLSDVERKHVKPFFISWGTRISRGKTTERSSKFPQKHSKTNEESSKGY